MLVQPVVAGVAALIILGEPLNGIMIAGGVVVITALTAIVRAAGNGGAEEAELPDLPQA